VTINVARHQAALWFLRAKYVRLLHEVRAAEAADRDPSLAAEALQYCVQDGLRVRADLEAAGVEVK
jgi:hypothetical protein